MYRLQLGASRKIVVKLHIIWRIFFSVSFSIMVDIQITRKRCEVVESFVLNWSLSVKAREHNKSGSTLF